MIFRLKEQPLFKIKNPIELEISDTIKKDINICWNEFIKDKSNFWDGDIFIVSNIDLDNNILEISKTKYSSLVYAHETNNLKVLSLFVSILLKTRDDKYVIIRNNHDKINIIGGLADSKDFKDGSFIPELCIEREVLEETGINIKDKNQVLDYCMKYMKVPIDNENYFPVGLIYTGTLNFTSEEFKNYMNNNTFDGEIKKCYFYSREECLNLDLTDADISYLREIMLFENNSYLNI